MLPGLVNARARKVLPEVMAWNRARGMVFWLVVDGRQPGYSMGMTIPELVQL